jgi:hypothetical protein
VRHIQKVNDLHGDNNYRDGSTEEPITSKTARYAERALRNY